MQGSEIEVEDSNSNPNAPSSGNSPSSNNEQKKTCADCGTTKTPLWRGGPAGPKVSSPSISQIAPRGVKPTLDLTLCYPFFQSLCNACGIRSRKKKRAILGINKGSTEDGRKGKRTGGGGGIGGIGGGALGREVLLHRSHWKKLGEEEKAAVLLMSLSYGSVYA